MKEGIHPAYREVCFVDLSNGFKFVTRSCAQTRETVKMDDGRELPLYKLESTSESHPFSLMAFASLMISESFGAVAL